MIHYKVSRCNEIGFKLLLLMLLMLVTWQALPPQPLEQIQNINDKLGHALVFFLLAVVSDHAFGSTRFNLKKPTYLLLYGIAIECIQHYIPGREFSFLDMLADAAGLLIYWLLSHYLFLRDPETDQNSMHSK